MRFHSGWPQLEVQPSWFAPHLCHLPTWCLLSPVHLTEPHDVCGSQYHLWIPTVCKASCLFRVPYRWQSLAQFTELCSFQGPMMFAHSCVLCRAWCCFGNPKPFTEPKPLPLQVIPLGEMPFCKPGKRGIWLQGESPGLQPRDLNSGPSSVTTLLWDLEHVLSPFWASVFSPVKWRWWYQMAHPQDRSEDHCEGAQKMGVGRAVGEGEGWG